jgi:hypothetical protein
VINTNVFERDAPAELIEDARAIVLGLLSSRALS